MTAMTRSTPFRVRRARASAGVLAAVVAATAGCNGGPVPAPGAQRGPQPSASSSAAPSSAAAPSSVAAPVRRGDPACIDVKTGAGSCRMSPAAFAGWLKANTDALVRVTTKGGTVLSIAELYTP
jgi:hypothetical protein